ncbi:MAG: class I SAM-dependent methyltransferase [Anaerolineae bacterium]|nr:class I SAM-dependent methyltransferase [Anaerolineae bacterium]
MRDQDIYDRLLERYESGQVPWGEELPPPEIIALAEKLPPGRALDLGCGYGRSAIYLAKKGWRVDGIDFIPLAIAGAISRAEREGVSDQVEFHMGRVTDMSFLSDSFDLAIDVGCMHALDNADLRRYRDGVYRLLKPGGQYVLFAHLRDDKADVPGRGIYEETVYELFNTQFTLENVRLGKTQVEDKPPWASAWFWYRRN